MASPSYYTRGTLEVWDFIREQDLNYFLGNAIKYICRAGYKDSKVEDLKKAIHYLENELQYTLRESKPVGPSNRVPARISGLELSFESTDSEEFDR